MEVYWQSIFVMMLVGMAVAYLVIKQTRRRKAKSGCSHCPVIKGAARSRTGIRTRT